MMLSFFPAFVAKFRRRGQPRRASQRFRQAMKNLGRKRRGRSRNSWQGLGLRYATGVGVGLATKSTINAIYPLTKRARMSMKSRMSADSTKKRVEQAYQTTEKQNPDSKEEVFSMNTRTAEFKRKGKPRRASQAQRKAARDLGRKRRGKSSDQWKGLGLNVGGRTGASVGAGGKTIRAGGKTVRAGMATGQVRAGGRAATATGVGAVQKGKGRTDVAVGGSLAAGKRGVVASGQVGVGKGGLKATGGIATAGGLRKKAAATAAKNKKKNRRNMAIAGAGLAAAGLGAAALSRRGQRQEGLPGSSMQTQRQLEPQAIDVKSRRVYSRPSGKTANFSATNDGRRAVSLSRNTFSALFHYR